MSKHLSSPAELKEMLAGVDTILLDCDGVLWHGDKILPNIKETLEYFRSLGKDIVFVTNNATKSRRQYKAKFDKLGIQASEEEIFGSAYASAVYLSTVLKFPKDKKVFVIGEAGLEEELKAEGINYCGGSDPKENVFLPSLDFGSLEFEDDVGAVLCGFDTSINYSKLAKAHHYLTTPTKDGSKVHFILTNSDSTFPAGGKFYPGSGAISAPLRYSTGLTPMECGKPEKTMMDCIVAKRHFDLSRTVMVGDRLNTDIEFGNQSGTSTLLVLTGVTQPEEIEEGNPKNTSGTVPTFVVQSLGDFGVLAKGE